MFSYRDQKHRDQFVAKMATDKECQEGYKEFTKPDYSRLSDHYGRIQKID